MEVEGSPGVLGSEPSCLLSERASSSKCEYWGPISDAGSRGVVCAWKTGAASMGSVELIPCRRAGCTGVKSGTEGVDETDEKRNVGVGGAP